ncbi:hypothetical protein Ancab_039867 [Ancistrocladus abbreviatus]
MPPRLFLSLSLSLSLSAPQPSASPGASFPRRTSPHGDSPSHRPRGTPHSQLTHAEPPTPPLRTPHTLSLTTSHSLTARIAAVHVSNLPYTFPVESSSEIIRSSRSGELPPAHYKLDINSFSLLTSSLPVGSHSFESTEFSVGGYRWAIQIYPHGNEKENGDGHISIYLRLCDKLKSGSVINVIFRALVYDYERNKYLVIQDRCTFGAEVFIINATIPTSAEVCNMESGRDRSYTWRIERFSELPNSAYSPEFTVEGRTWKLNAWPGGCGTQKGKSFSLYLCLCQYADLAAGNKLYVEYELHLKN